MQSQPIDSQLIKLKEFQKKNRYTGEQVANMLNISRSLLYKLYTGERSLTDDLRTNIGAITNQRIVNFQNILEERQSNYKINEKLIPKIVDLELSKSVGGRTTKENGYIPFYDRDVTASKMTLFEDKAIPPTQFYFLPNFSDCTAIFPVYGDSMYPRFRAGDRVVVKEYPHFQSYIQFGEVFLVFTENEERMIKVVRRSDKSGFIKLVSVNQEYDDFEIPVNIITKMFIVKGKICIEND